jgi:hypothetical protein
MPYLSNPVQRAQETLSNTIRGGLSQLGNRRLEDAKFGLQKAGLEHQMGREVKQDERADRSLGIREEQLGLQKDMQEHTIGMQNDQEERQAQSAMQATWMFNQQKPGVIAARKQAEFEGKNLDQMVDLRNQHLNGKGMALFYLGPNASRETLSDFLASGKINQIMKATGATVEIVDGETRYRKKKDGKLATWWDMPKISPIANDVLLSGTDPILKTKQNIREHEKLMAQGAGTPEQHEQYLKMKKVVGNANWQIAQYEKLQDIDFEKRTAYKQRGMDTSVFETNIARRTNKIASIKAAQAATAKQRGKERIAEINAAGKLIGSLEKDSTFLAKVTGLTEAEATDIIRADKTMAESIRGASQELKLIDDLTYDTPEALAEKVKQIRESWGLDAYSLEQRRVAKPTIDPDPNPDKLEIKELLFKQ